MTKGGFNMKFKVACDDEEFIKWIRGLVEECVKTECRAMVQSIIQNEIAKVVPLDKIVIERRAVEAAASSIAYRGKYEASEIVSTPAFKEEMREAARNQIKALLESRYSDSNMDTVLKNVVREALKGVLS